VLSQLASGETITLGMPGEEHLRALLLKKASAQLNAIDEANLVKYIGLLRGICDGIIEGGEKWDLVIATSSNGNAATAAEKESSTA
jgi:predicted type IV restriction endonuclease